LPDRGEILPIGRGRVLREGEHAAILSFGARLAEALEAARILEDEGVSVTVADARFAKPLDRDLIRRLAHEHRALVTLEDGASGGFGAQVLLYLSESGLLDTSSSVRAMALPDAFLDHDTQPAMYACAGLDAEAVAAVVKNLTV